MKHEAVEPLRIKVGGLLRKELATTACSSSAVVGAIRNAAWYLPSRASWIASARSAV